MRLTIALLKTIKTLHELLEQQKKAYGEQVSSTCGVGQGNVCNILKRLENAGLLTSRLETPAECHQRFGSTRRVYYFFTDKGERFFKDMEPLITLGARLTKLRKKQNFEGLDMPTLFALRVLELFKGHEEVYGQQLIKACKLGENLYPILNRFEKEGLVTSRREGNYSTSRRYYRLTDKGAQLFRK